MPDFITIKNLSSELGMGNDISNLRKYILRKVPEVNLVKVRTAESRGQLTLALSNDDAEIVRQTRERDGFTEDKTPSVGNGVEGIFYVIQLIPEFDPTRVKLGFTNSIEARLQGHRTSAPTAKLVKTWDCKRTWEEAAIASATRIECQLIANEVFACDSLDSLISRLDSFFDQLPAPDFRLDRVEV